jgi:putative copper export protein
MNPLGRLIAIISLSLWAYGIFTDLITQNDNSWAFILERLFLGLIILSLPILAFGLAFRYEYKKEKERIKKICQNPL